MSATGPEGHAHEEARPLQRRDMLGLASLFPAGSSFVPLSDIDAGASFGGALEDACSAPSAGRSRPHCAGCALPCPSETNWSHS